MSAEHVISKSVLRAVSDFDKRLSLIVGREGSQLRVVGIGNATVKNLCTAHNSQLHELDDEALRLARSILTAMTPTHAVNVIEGRAEPVHERFDGALLERWALKTFINSCHSQLKRGGNFEFGGDALVEHVFRGTPLPEGSGIYLLRRPERQFRGLAGPMPFGVHVVEATKNKPHPIFVGVQVPEISCPIYMAINFGPFHLAVCANVTTLDQASWTEMMNGFGQAGNIPQGYFHPAFVTFEWHDERAIENVFIDEVARPWSDDQIVVDGALVDAPPLRGNIMLLAQFNWTAHDLPFPMSVILNRWIRYNPHGPLHQ